MTDFSYLTVRVNDWGVTSYGDFSVLAGVGGGIWHFNFRSPSLNRDMHYIMPAGGFGVSAEAEGRVGVLINQVAARMKGLADGMTGYTRVPRHCRPFSFMDLAGGFAALASGNVALGAGHSEALLTVSTGQTRLFESLPMSGTTVGVGVSLSTVYGVLLMMGGGDPAEQAEITRRRRYERERDHYRGAPAIRDPGGV